MPCYHPVPLINKSQWPVPGTGLQKFSNIMHVPCGKCIGCRMDRSKMWAIRCVHESKCWEKNAFVTLTYNEEALVTQCPGGSLNKRDFVLFMKKLRRKNGAKIKYFHCGEYGKDFSRPHHHACIFNWWPSDATFWKESESGEKLYKSDSLDGLWGFGYTIVGNVSEKSAAYVARYIIKKLPGASGSNYYGKREPEYVTMSRRPGLGAAFLEQYSTDIYPCGSVVLGGQKYKPPRYYDEKYKKINPERLEEIKNERVSKINPAEQTKARLRAREKCLEARVKQLKRSYEGA